MADSNNEEASPKDGWVDGVVEGAAAAKSAESGPGGVVHEIDGDDDDDELLFSSAMPDEPQTGGSHDQFGQGSLDGNDVAETTENVEADSSVDDTGNGQVATDPVSVEGLISDLERVTEEKNQYLDTSRRLQADFDNYRKRVAKDTADAKIRGKESVVSGLLNVLDACDGAVQNGAEDVEPIRVAILSSLASQGLERIDPVDAPFDPELHEAVMHEPAEGGDGPTVAEVMRPGYSISGRVVRPAMVRVRG